MYIHNIDPILLNLGIIEIRWYSLAYIVGILAGWWLGKKILAFKIENQKLIFKLEDFDNLITYLIIAIILGGRLGYIFFYNFSYYMTHPLDIVKIWEGGMSFHGALIGIVLGTYLFSKKHQIKTFILLDIVACVSPVGIFFGRLANFVNSELIGKPSEIMWSVIFVKIDNISRHPSQIYEALLEGLLLFTILIVLTFKKEVKNGLCSSYFLMLYGIFRIFCEQFREPDKHIGYFLNYFSLGTILSSLMIVAGVFIYFNIKKQEF